MANGSGKGIVRRVTKWFSSCASFAFDIWMDALNFRDTIAADAIFLAAMGFYFYLLAPLISLAYSVYGVVSSVFLVGGSLMTLAATRNWIVMVPSIILCFMWEMGHRYFGTVTSRLNKVRNGVNSRTWYGRTGQYTYGFITQFWFELLIVLLSVVISVYVAYRKVRKASKKQTKLKANPLIADVVYRVCTTMTGLSFIIMLVHGSWKDVTMMISALTGLGRWTKSYLTSSCDDEDGDSKKSQKSHHFVRGGDRCHKHRHQEMFSISEKSAYNCSLFLDPDDRTDLSDRSKVYSLIGKVTEQDDIIPDFADNCDNCLVNFYGYVLSRTDTKPHKIPLKTGQFAQLLGVASGDVVMPTDSEHPGLGSQHLPLEDKLEEVAESSAPPKAQSWANRVAQAIWGRKYFILVAALLTIGISALATYVFIWYYRRKRNQAKTPNVSDVSPPAGGRRRKKTSVDDDGYTSDNAYDKGEDPTDAMFGADNPYVDLVVEPEEATKKTPNKPKDTTGGKSSPEKSVKTVGAPDTRTMCPSGAACKCKSPRHVRRFRHPDVTTESYVPRSMPIEIDYAKLVFFCVRGDKEDSIIGTGARVHNMILTADHVRRALPSHMVVFNAPPKWSGVENRSKFQDSVIAVSIPVEQLKIAPGVGDVRDICAIFIPNELAFLKTYKSGKIAVGEQVSVIGFHSSQNKVMGAGGAVTKMANGIIEGAVTTDWGVSGGPWLNAHGQIVGVHTGVRTMNESNYCVALTKSEIDLTKNAQDHKKEAIAWSERLNSKETAAVAAP